MKLFTTLITLITLSGASLAQNKKEKETQYDVSLVCIGARSDAYWTGKGAKTKVFATDPGAVPPSDLVIETKDKDKRAGKHKTDIRPAMNSATKYVTITGSVFEIKKRSMVDERAKYSGYRSIPLPQPAGAYSVFLARKPRAKDWTSPQQLVLSDSLSDFPPGSARIVNLSDRDIVAKIGSKVVAKIKPGKKLLIKGIIKKENPLKLSLMYQTNKKVGSAFRRTLSFSPTTRKTIVCCYKPRSSKPISATLISAVKLKEKTEDAKRVTARP